MKDHVSRLGWLVRLAVIVGILLLATRVEISQRSVQDPSLGGRLTAPVSGVLPGTVTDLRSTPARASDTMRLDCEDSTPYRPSKSRIAC